MIKKIFISIPVFVIGWALIVLPVSATNVQVVHASGAGNNLTVASNNDIDLMGDFTIEQWFNADSWAGGGSTALLSNYDGSNLGYKWMCQANGDGCFFQTDNTTNHIGTFNASTATWYHIAWVQSGTNLKEYVASTSESTHGLYFNGAYTEHSASGGNLKLYNLNNDYAGNMDELRIWSVARTAAQLDSNFKNELCGTESGLVAYYRFEGNANDETANAYNFTTTGAPTYPSTAPFSTGSSGCTTAAGPIDAIIWFDEK